MRHLAWTAAILLFANAASLAQGQSPDHDKHHPDQQEVPATKPSTPSQPRPGMGSPSGMQGGGMMHMMGGKQPMMDMMQMMGMMRQSGGSMGMATIDRVEGRIAFLRSELKITDAQSAAWDTFADALRANAKRLGEVRSSIAAGAQRDLTDRLELQERWLSARLEGTRAMKAAFAGLADKLSDEQKKAADELLAPHLGMMAMMQSGQMPPGR